MADKQSPAQEHYPPYVINGEQRRRWDFACAIVGEVFDNEAERWQAARALYDSDISTDPPAEGLRSRADGTAAA